MASISREPNGHRSIQFVAGDGKRRTIRLGKVSQKTAITIKGHVEELNNAKISGDSIARKTAVWLTEIGGQLREKLAKVELTDHREQVALGDFIASFIRSRTDAKPNTVSKWRTTEESLLEHFGADTPIADITDGEVDQWRRSLAKGRVENTVRKYIASAKVFFNAAVRQRLLERSPFADQSATIMPNESRAHYVSREDAEKVLGACPDAEWRLIFALSRFGGLRCPSEHLALRWEDIDWANQRIKVRSSKTEHLGKGFRFVPIFPELESYLEDVRELAPDGSEYVINRYRNNNANLRTQFMRILDRAGIAPWPKLFQNLRSTRQTELESEFPLHVVCSWLGNSEKVARRHYLQVHDQHFAKAVAKKALQNPVQQTTEMPGSAPHYAARDSENPRKRRTSSSFSHKQVVREGLEPPTKGL